MAVVTSMVDAYDKLLAFRDKLQAMCYWYKETGKHASCRENNKTLCCFCELVEELSKLL